MISRPQNNIMIGSESEQQRPPPKGPLSFWNWSDIKGRAKEIIEFLPHFLRNPVEGVKRVPSWDWPTAILLEVLLSSFTGVLTGIVERSFLAVLFGLIFAPIMGLTLCLITAGILFYSCLFVLKTEVEFRRVFVIVVLATIPYQILHIVVPILKLVTPINIVVTALLLIVGMSDNFMLEKKKVTKIVGTLAAVILVFWLYATLTDVTSNRIKVQDYTPDSLDQIHKELNDSK